MPPLPRVALALPWSSPLLAAAVLDPPLDPTPDEGRRALRRELIDPQYYEQDRVQRLLDWLSRWIDGAVTSAANVSSLTWLAATAIAVALGAALVLLVSRARFSSRGDDHATAVLTDDAVSAAELRARAEEALAEGRFADAVLDGFRAVAVQQVERGRLENAPGSTAREVSAALVEQYPDSREQVQQGARLFDAVMYGDRPATRDEAAAVLAVDQQLRSRR